MSPVLNWLSASAVGVAVVSVRGGWLLRGQSEMLCQPHAVLWLRRLPRRLPQRSCRPSRQKHPAPARGGKMMKIQVDHGKCQDAFQCLECLHACRSRVLLVISAGNPFAERARPDSAGRHFAVHRLRRLPAGMSDRSHPHRDLRATVETPPPAVLAPQTHG